MVADDQEADTDRLSALGDLDMLVRPWGCVAKSSTVYSWT